MDYQNLGATSEVSAEARYTPHRGGALRVKLYKGLSYAITVSIFVMVGWLMMSQHTVRASGITRWEYMTVRYTEFDIDRDNQVEPLIEVSHPEFLYLMLLCEGSIFSESYRTCAEENGVVQSDMLTLVGDAGWEMVFFDNNSTTSAYSATFFFKRPKP